MKSSHSLQHIQSVGILFHEDGQHHRDSQHAGAAITQEGQGNADDGHQANGHAYVDGKMHEKDACNGIAINTAEVGPLSLGQRNKANQQGHIKQHDSCRTQKATFLAHGAENKVGVLLGHKIVFRLGAFKEAFASQTT